MGKIEGWKKILNKKNNMEWQQVKGYNPLKGYPMYVEIRKVHVGWLVLYGVHDTILKSRAQALKFAIQYMRKHPRG